MAVFNVTATDTGVAVTTAAPARLVARAQPTTTGLTSGDSIAAQRSFGKTLTDTGLAVTDSLIPGLHVVVLTDSGLQSGTPGAGPGGPLDNFNRANETPLSGGGNWGHTGSVVQTLNLVSNQAVATGVPGQMNWVAGGALGDCEAYCTITQLPLGASGVVGVVCRQQTAQPTGEDAYFAYLTTSGVVVVGFWDGSGFANSFAVYTLSPAAQVGDKIGLQVKGDNGANPITLKTWYQSASGGGWRLLGTTLAPFFTLATGYIGLRIGSPTGGAADDFGGGLPSIGLSDGIAAAKINGRAISDTGLTVSDSLFRYFSLTDTGLTITDSMSKRIAHALADTALTLTDSLGQIALTDTGLNVTDSLTRQRVVPRNLTDTGATVTDSLPKVARKVLSDTGLALTADLVARKNTGNVSVNITTVGLTITTSISKAAHLFRAIPGSTSLPDQGVTITDGIRITTSPPKPPPKKPVANFTYAATGLAVAFTDTSTPGSAPIGSWSWHFGDGGTSSATNPSYTYGADGTYNVTLTVVTIYGHSSVTKPVTVSSTVTAGVHIDAVIA
jgi:hypothetical protein